jgi:hypothetical protein
MVKRRLFRTKEAKREIIKEPAVSLRSRSLKLEDLKKLKVLYKTL